jgi:hypothetical protein
VLLSIGKAERRVFAGVFSAQPGSVRREIDKSSETNDFI